MRKLTKELKEKTKTVALNKNLTLNDLIYEVYNNEQNIYYKKTNSKHKRAIIFFAGNAIFYPQTKEVFISKIIRNNYFEWERIAKNRKILKYYSLIIFVRDLNRCWYTKGINKNINSFDKVIKLIEDLTKNYEVTTVGNSAGGYMAILTGLKIKAKRIFNFSGQIELDKNQIQQAKSIAQKEPQSLFPYLKNNEIKNLFSFYPYKNEQDYIQIQYLKSCNIPCFKFNENLHGRTVAGVCYPYLLTCSNAKLYKKMLSYENKIIDKSKFLRFLQIKHFFAKKFKLLKIIFLTSYIY